MSLFSWLRSWFVGAKVVREVNYLLQKSEEAVAKREALNATLAKDLQEFRKLQEAVERDLEKAEQLAESHGKALDAMRHELKIATDVTIPTLVQAHRLVLSRYDAEVAIQVHRQSAVSSSGGS